MSDKRKNWRLIFKDKLALVGFIILISVPGVIISSVVRDNGSDIVNDRQTNVSFIKEAVEGINLNSTFPVMVDEVTTATGIAAETNAIRYYLLIEGADTAGLSDVVLKESVVASVCKKDNVEEYLNRGINLIYDYTVSETGQKFLVNVSETDCL